VEIEEIKRASREKLLEYLPQAETDQERGYVLVTLAQKFIGSDLSKATEFIAQARRLEPKLDRDFGIYLNITEGNICFNRGDFPAAEENYARALALAKELGNQGKIAQVLNNLGIVCWKEGKYSQSLEYLSEALKIREQVGDDEDIAQTYENIGIVYYSIGEYETALEHFGNALQLWRKLENPSRIAGTLNNIGALYRETGNYEKALEYLQKSLEYKRKIGDRGTLASTLGNIGTIYAQQGDYSRGLEYLSEALELAQENRLSSLEAETYAEMAQCHYAGGEIEGAEKLALKSLELTESLGMLSESEKSAQLLSEIYAARRKYKKAWQFLKKVLGLREKIFSDRLDSAVAELKVKYETDKRRREAEIYHLKYVELKRINEELVATKEALEKYKKHLEQLVAERTAELERSYRRLKKTFSGIVATISKMLELRDPYTAGHQERVARLSVAIARQLDLPEDKIEAIHTAAMLHDIGKIYVPSEILTKPGRLSDVEFMLIKNHPAAGYEILKSIEFPWDIATIVRQHHERLDGSGYPDGLVGDQILFEAKIIAVADVVEAISSHRPYRPALGIDVALAEIRKNAGKLYDPAVVEACVAVFESGFEW